MAYQSWSVVFGEQPSAAKWNILGQNDASFADGTGIADGAVTPEKLLTGTGTSWAWQSWTPTLTNLSGGTLNYAKYIQVGKSVFFRFQYTLAGAGVAGSVSFTLPVTAISGASAQYPLGNVSFIDTGTGTAYGLVILESTTAAGLRAQLASGTYVSTAGLSSTVPHTWASTDVIVASGYYEAA